MRGLAAAVIMAIVAACGWLAWLSERPVEWFLDGSGFDELRVTAIAIVVGGLAAAATAIAAWRGLGASVVAAIGIAGLATTVGVARRPALPQWVTDAVDVAWLVTPAAIIAIGIVTWPGARAIPARRGAVAAVGVVMTGVSAVALAGGSALGATIGRSAPIPLPGAARVALAAEVVILVSCLRWGSRRVAGRLARDPIVIATRVWLVTTIVERALHLLPIEIVRDDYLGKYEAWALVVGVHLPLAAAGATMCTLAWTYVVRPRAERLPSGTLVLPRRDPIEMLRDDLAAWVGDPTLRLAFADGAGRWVSPSGEHRPADSGYDRATTVVTRGADAIGLLEHDIALRDAPDVLRTAAVLAGLAFDANQWLAVSEGRLIETTRLGDRLLSAEAAMRTEIGQSLDDGPLGRLRRCADDLRFGASIASTVETIRVATADVREISHGLYPPELIEGGLGAVAGDRPGAPRRRLPPAVEVTAFQLVADDPSASFEDLGSRLRVQCAVASIPPRVLDRIAVLDGVVHADAVVLPVGDR